MKSAPEEQQRALVTSVRLCTAVHVLRGYELSNYLFVIFQFRIHPC